MPVSIGQARDILRRQSGGEAGKGFLVLTQRLIRLGQVRQGFAVLPGLGCAFIQAGGFAPPRRSAGLGWCSGSRWWQ